MQRFETLEFIDRDVVIDGNEYFNCVFTRCRVIYRGAGVATLSDCTFIESQFVLEESAANTLQFLTALYHGGPGLSEVVEATFNEIRGSANPPGDYGFDIG